MAQLQPVSTKQARITISNMGDLKFTSISGGKFSREEVKYNDGNTGIERTHPGFVSIEPLTISKPYDPLTEKVIDAAIKLGNKVFTIEVQAVTAESSTGSNIGGSVLYNNCILMAYTPAKFDRDGSGLARTELMFAVNELPRYA
jgi:hypothetical protein